MVVAVDSLPEGGTWCMHGEVMGIIFKIASTYREGLAVL
jgi:hypothetical protein